MTVDSLLWEGVSEESAAFNSRYTLDHDIFFISARQTVALQKCRSADVTLRKCWFCRKKTDLELYALAFAAQDVNTVKPMSYFIKSGTTERLSECVGQMCIFGFVLHHKSVSEFQEKKNNNVCLYSFPGISLSWENICENMRDCLKNVLDC